MHKNTVNLSGESFGKLLVTGKANNIGGRVAWFCQCECGGFKAVISTNLTSGKTTSCGCNRIKHGNSGKPEYLVWYSMVDRCTKKDHKFWHRYGGRGITVCDEWKSFESFISDMGERPSSKHQLDRIDNDCGYFVENCRWVLAAENLRNRKDSKYWHVNGTRYESMRHAAKHEGVAHSTIKNWCNKNINGCYSVKKYGSEDNG